MTARVLTLLVRIVLAASVAIGAFESVRGFGTDIRDVPPSRHLDAWTASADARLQEFAGPWHPSIAAVRAHVPESAIVVSWIAAGSPPRDSDPWRHPGFTCLRVLIAPRILLEVDRPEQVLAHRSYVENLGYPVFLLEHHPRRGGDSRPAVTDRWIVADHPDFTLRRMPTER